jgi:REP element-mobilizing transposase RayT
MSAGIVEQGLTMPEECRGAYFITLCAHQRECLFGDMDSMGMLTLSAIGQIVAEEWRRSALIRREIQLDAFVVMPNHVHRIAIFTPAAPEDIEACVDVGAHGRAPLPM